LAIYDTLCRPVLAGPEGERTVRSAPIALLAAVIAILLILSCGEGEKASSSPADEVMLSSHRSDGISWETDWNRAMARAKAENKLVMANFSADWCIWCKRYDSSTFADSEVQKLIAAKVVPLKLVIDGADAPRARSLRVQAPPTLVFLDPAANEKARIPGYMPPGRFLDTLQGILQQG
jgi:thiol:disulfide interchange protein